MHLTMKTTIVMYIACAIVPFSNVALYHTASMLVQHMRQLMVMTTQSTHAQMPQPPSMLKNQPLLRGRNAVMERFEVAKGAATKIVASTLDYEKYPKLFASGGLCASVTHLVTVPLDVVKTRMQVTPGAFTGINDGISKIYAAEGIKGCMQGATPTFLGFMMQGALKYGFYEYFKDTLAQNSPKSEGGKLPVPQMIVAADRKSVV